MRLKDLDDSTRRQIVRDFLITEDAAMVAQRYDLQPHDVIWLVVQANPIPRRPVPMRPELVRKARVA